MTAPHRTPAGGRIDRDTDYEFTFGGRTLTGHPGDTLASALLAHGIHHISSSVKYGRPRGISAAWAEDTSGLVQIDAPFSEPMLLASTVELYDGLAATGIPGQGRLSEVPDPARYDAMHAHADLLVVGAGPAGLMAALTAARSGARVVVVDEQSEPGGALLGSADRIDGAPTLDWVRSVVEELATFPEVRHLQRTTAFGHYDDGFVLALERRTDHLGGRAPEGVSRQRVWRIRAKHVIVATGAHERPVVFADNDRPGIMLAHSARTFLHRYGVLVGREAAVFTTNDSAYVAAFDLADAGTAIKVIVDARPHVREDLRSECDRRGISLRQGAVVCGTRGEERITHALITGDAGAEAVSCDVLLVSGGWNPAVHLFSQVRGTLRYDSALGGFVPDAPVENVSVAGSASGVMDRSGCLRQGQASALAALAELGIETGEPAAVPNTPADDVAPGLVLWRVSTGDDDAQFVDVQRDATVADLGRAVGAGMRSMEHIKRYTTIGTAHDQGKTSG
ncbi:MAG: sarcosine oxidase, subunit alpha, partial [Mycobacterium sp.]|nr:sarcosine oxidase, subunit alpha [Mycobacterium sp.]